MLCWNYIYISDRFKLEKDIGKNFNFKSALIIGFFQIISLVPGVSCITITAARLLNFKRWSAKISFLLSIPTLGTVSFFRIRNIIFFDDVSFSQLNLISIILSIVFSLGTIKFFLKFIQSFSLIIFVIYRVILGSVVLYFAYL